MMTSCGPTVMPEVLENLESNGRASPVYAKELNAEAHEITLVQDLILDHINRLIPGPATSAGRYQVETGGSLLRARLALSSGRAFGCSREYRVAAGAACELIHNASLVHDDLLDRDELRRGSASVWKRFGDGVALCAGDLLLCAAFGVAAELKNPVESRLLSQNLTGLTGRVIVGQSMELAASDGQQPPRFRDYLEATGAKTAPLIELPLMTGALAGSANESVRQNLRQLASAIGLAYQVIDDLDDLGSGRAVLHAFHAWNHHRQGQKDNPQLRIRRATRHAVAALVRARNLVVQLEQLEPGVTAFLSPALIPLLVKLEHRALAHRQYVQAGGESIAYDQAATA